MEPIIADLASRFDLLPPGRRQRIFSMLNKRNIRNRCNSKERELHRSFTDADLQVSQVFKKRAGWGLGQVNYRPSCMVPASARTLGAQTV